MKNIYSGGKYFSLNIRKCWLWPSLVLIFKIIEGKASLHYKIEDSYVWLFSMSITNMQLNYGVSGFRILNYLPNHLVQDLN